MRKRTSTEPAFVFPDKKKTESQTFSQHSCFQMKINKSNPQASVRISRQEKIRKLNLQPAFVLPDENKETSPPKPAFALPDQKKRQPQPVGLFLTTARFHPRRKCKPSVKESSCGPLPSEYTSFSVGSRQSRGQNRDLLNLYYTSFSVGSRQSRGQNRGLLRFYYTSFSVESRP